MKELNALIIEGILRDLDDNGWGHIRCNNDLIGVKFNRKLETVTPIKIRVVGSLKKGNNISAYIVADHVEIKEHVLQATMETE